MGMRTIALVHSPFLGPGSMRPLADVLVARGHRVVVPDLRDGLRATPCHDGIAARFAAQVPGEPLLVAGHSGAGPLLPHLARPRPGSHVVYVDAGLPTPGRSWHDTAPAELYDTLASGATVEDTGDRTELLLQPWHTWFDPSPLTSEALRDAVLPDEPRVPVRFLREPRPHTDEPPSAYLRLSAPYDSAAEHARARHLPVRSLPASHLATVDDPEPVAAAVETLARALD
ncbi:MULTISPECIES: alpha/beta fold hydrolase [Prauserella salsuginis group]|uniref:Alpha/beta hydrolase family protein n=2 Tax=Prauserella salsuginis group TaxID=2893672 RepID=A0A839XQE8_9PSEU|nr:MULTISPECIES: hypothetical protein [Prauserella salsuginis group]MBB3662873.1 hypothetical protein [Prauserella sediminis]MCR3720570.1 Alpha/beta hydrolase family [Prauserella flava]MCR3733720.1 Alpha/beta hydrolase family [Prauserella salsuginis]